MAPAYPEPPKNIAEFSRRFATEEACAAYLFNLRYPDGYKCSKCGSVRAWQVAEKPGTMICENNHKVSVTAGTSLARTKQPLTLWFHAAWLVATLKPGISAVQFQRQMGLTRLETALAMLHKLRSGLFAPDRETLTSVCGDHLHTDHWVEVDEVLIGGKEESLVRTPTASRSSKREVSRACERQQDHRRIENRAYEAFWMALADADFDPLEACSPRTGFVRWTQRCGRQSRTAARMFELPSQGRRSSEPRDTLVESLLIVQEWGLPRLGGDQCAQRRHRSPHFHSTTLGQQGGSGRVPA